MRQDLKIPDYKYVYVEELIHYIQLTCTVNMSFPRKIPAQNLLLISRFDMAETSLNSSMQSEMDCIEQVMTPDVDMTDLSSETDMNRLHEDSCEYDINQANSPITIVPSPNISHHNSINSNMSLENPIIPTIVIQDIEMTDLSSINVSSNASSDNDIRQANSPNVSNSSINVSSNASNGSSDNTSSNISSNISNLSLEMEIKPSSTPKKIQ